MLLVIFSQCAQQTALSGGERDTSPPELDSNKVVIPANGTTNFSAQRITIPFNEFVQLKDKDKQILITPFLETKPDIYVKGKKVVVDFNGALDANTTYIINFGKSIVDLTEGNEMVNYRYVFSTGSFIDSLQYHAAVYDAYNKTPVEGAYVMLYKSLEDSVLLKAKPNYFGVTDKQGNCSIENIAGGEYKIVTFLEENGNYLWEAKSEKIGFTHRRLNAAQDTIVDTLSVFQNYPDELKIEDLQLSSNGKGFIKFNQSLADEVTLANDSLLKSFAHLSDVEDQRYYFWTGINNDTLNFYIKPELEDGKKYEFGVTDVSRKFMVPARDTVLSFTSNAATGIKPKKDLTFNFSEPIISWDDEKVTLKLGDSTLKVLGINDFGTKMQYSSNWVPGESYEITLIPGAVTSYRGNTNDTIKAFFEVKEERDYGNLNLSFDLATGDYILFLIKEGKIIQQDYHSTGGKFNKSYQLLEPGDYRVQLIFDENGNKLWDTGDYFEHIQPERVEYYSDPIKIKKGWDMEVEWVIRD